MGLIISINREIKNVKLEQSNINSLKSIENTNLLVLKFAIDNI